MYLHKNGEVFWGEGQNRDKCPLAEFSMQMAAALRANRPTIRASLFATHHTFA